MEEGVKPVPAEAAPPEAEEIPVVAVEKKPPPTVQEQTMDHLALSMRMLQRHWERLNRWEKMDYDHILIFMKDQRVDIRKLPNPVIPKIKNPPAAAPRT